MGREPGRSWRATVARSRRLLGGTPPPAGSSRHEQSRAAPSSHHDPSLAERPSLLAQRHGYPLGFAKSQWHLRDRLAERLRHRVLGFNEVEQQERAASIEAVARALEWERLLGSFNHAGEDRFPPDTVDEVADHLLLWLEHQGFRVVPTAPDPDEEPLPEVPLRAPNVFDNARRTFVLIRD